MKINTNKNKCHLNRIGSDHTNDTQTDRWDFFQMNFKQSINSLLIMPVVLSDYFDLLFN